MTTHFNGLSIACWNVQGLENRLHSKLNDKLFMNQIRKHDIISLVETHGDDNSPTNFNVLDDYSTFISNRKKSGNKRHGGIVLLVKKQFVNNKAVTFYKSSTPDIVWLKLDRKYFNEKNDIFICTAYISPSNYSRKNDFSDDPYDILTMEIAKYSQKGDIILTGDFNSRTGIADDYIINDQNIEVGNNLISSIDSFHLKRSSMDNTIDSNGKRLLDLCKSANLRILNGRTFGDSNGTYTCHKYNGSSVVDYFICSQNMVNLVISFRVSCDFSELSDHSKVSTVLRINTPQYEKIVDDNKT